MSDDVDSDLTDLFPELSLGSPEITEAAQQSADMSESRLNLESRLAGSTDPNYASTLEAFDGYSHEEMYASVQALQPGEMGDTSRLWHEAATSVQRSCLALVFGVHTEINESWDGPTSGRVHSMTDLVNRSGLDSATVMQSVGMRLDQATTVAEALRSTVPPPSSSGPIPMEIAVDPVLAYAEEQRRAEEERRRAADVLNTIYTPQLRPTGDAVPAFGSAGPSSSGGAGGGSAGSGAVPGSGTGSSGVGSPLGPGGVGLGDGIGAGGEPADTRAAGLGDGGAAAGSPTGAAAGSPGSGTAGAPGTGTGTGTSSGAPSGAGAAPVGVPPGTTRPATAGPAATSPGARSAAPGGLSSGNGGSGGGGGGLGGGPANGLGARPGPGGSVPAGTGGGAVPGGNGPGMRSGFMPAGMMPMGRGSGDDEREHRAASYLVTPDNRNELIGELPATVTPVLGEWEDES